MNDDTPQLWLSLSDTLRALPPYSSVATLYNTLATWLRNNGEQIGAELMHLYGLDTYSTLSPEDYAIDSAGVNVDEEINSLLRLNPETTDTIAMLIRDQLWNLLAFKTSQECPNCGQDELRVLIDDQRLYPSFVLACDICAWAQNPDGSRWSGEPRLRPATKSELISGGYIARESSGAHGV